MAEWGSKASFKANYPKEKNKLTKALMTAAFHGDMSGAWVDVDDIEYFVGTVEKDLYRYNLLDGVTFEYDGDCIPETLFAVFCALSESVLALFPNSIVNASYHASLSIGGGNFGVCYAKNGIVTMAEVDIDDVSAQVDDGGYYDEDDEWVETDPDLLARLLACTDWKEECREYLTYQISSDTDSFIIVQYPDYTVNWNGEGTYKVLRAAVEAEEFEAFKTAAEKGIITHKQLKDALAVSQNETDSEITAVLLQLIHEI